MFDYIRTLNTCRTDHEEAVTWPEPYCWQPKSGITDGFWAWILKFEHYIHYGNTHNTDAAQVGLTLLPLVHRTCEVAGFGIQRGCDLALCIFNALECTDQLRQARLFHCFIKQRHRSVLEGLCFLVDRSTKMFHHCGVTTIMEEGGR